MGCLSEMSAVSHAFTRLRLPFCFLVFLSSFKKLVTIVQTFLFNTGHKQLALLSVIPDRKQIQCDHNLIMRFLVLI